MDIEEVDVDKLKIDVQTNYTYKTEAYDTFVGEVAPPKIPGGVEKPKINLVFHTKAKHKVYDLRWPKKLFSGLRGAHQVENERQVKSIMDEINTGKVNIFDAKPKIDEPKHLKDLFKRMITKLNRKVARPTDMEISKFKLDVEYKQLKKVEQKIWEVFFDHKDKHSDKGHRIDPLILDLNKDGKFDITGANQEGNGKIDGDTVSFDIDPTKQSWKHNSPGHRPGWYEGRRSSLCAPIPNGKAIYNTGKTKIFGPKGVWIDDPSQGQSAKIYDAQSKWVGEWVAADWGYSHGGRLGRYYFSPYDQNEQTEWMKPGSGDGFLVWDKNGNGIIDDNTEMMSEFDANGNKKFQNGFEKLAYYFDKDNDGVVKGAELSQLKVWVDIDGDAKTDKGELQELSKHGITEIVVPSKGKMVSSYTTEELVQQKKTQNLPVRRYLRPIWIQKNCHLTIIILHRFFFLMKIQPSQSQIVKTSLRKMIDTCFVSSQRLSWV